MRKYYNDLVLGQKLSTLTLKFLGLNVTVHSTYAGSSGDRMSTGAERREARRFTMSLTMRVLARNHNQPELNASTRDVSYRGLYFLAEAKFEIGSEIEFVITLPRQSTQSVDVNIHCYGTVVRVEPTTSGRNGIAAKIDKYEFLSAAASAA